MRELLIDGELQIEVLIDAVDDGSAVLPGQPALVLLPSSQRDSLDFDELAGLLARAGFRVLRPQPRGMGRSHGPLDGLNLHVLAHDVVRVIERFGGGRAIVAGHAYGHFVARVADLDHPASVRGVVMLAAAARTIPAGLTESLDIAADTDRSSSERLAHLQRAFFAPGNDARPWLSGWHPALRAAYRRAGSTPGKAVWWPVSHAPILDLQAEEDPWRPPHTRTELQDVLGNKVTVRTIARASHALVAEQAEAIALAITDWARQLPR